MAAAPLFTKIHKGFRVKKYDRTWYTHAKGEDSLETSGSYGPLMVCLSSESYNKESIRLFSYFDYLDFIKLYAIMKEEEKCFFECIEGVNPQKPHFDLDLPNVTLNQAELVKDTLIESLTEILQEKYNIKLDLAFDLLMYSSHKPGEKYSYHILIDHYYHHSNKFAEALYKHVTERMLNKVSLMLPGLYPIDENGKFFISDDSVYKSFQQFRMLGSRKYGTTRIKIFHEEWNFYTNIIRYNYKRRFDSEYERRNTDFFNSLVTNINNCLPLDEVTAAKETGMLAKTSFVTPDDIAYELVSKAFQLCLDNPLLAPFPFTIGKTSGNCISLVKKEVSVCPICSRIHEHENPFLLVIDNKVYYDCRRRAEKERFYVGEISSGGTKKETFITVLGPKDLKEQEPKPPVLSIPSVVFQDESSWKDLLMESRSMVKQKYKTKQDALDGSSIRRGIFKSIKK